MKIHVAVDLVKLYKKFLAEGTVFVTVENLAKELSISTRSAGKILSKMCESGLIVKCSKTTYRVLPVESNDVGNRTATINITQF